MKPRKCTIHCRNSANCSVSFLLNYFHFGNSWISLQFSWFKDVLDMFWNCRYSGSIKNRHKDTTKTTACQEENRFLFHHSGFLSNTIPSPLIGCVNAISAACRQSRSARRPLLFWKTECCHWNYGYSMYRMFSTISPIMPYKYQSSYPIELSPSANSVESLPQ